MTKAFNEAKKTGDFIVLSKADLSLIALAIEFKEKGCKPIVLTDDFALQNVCRILKIENNPVFGRKI